MRRDTELAAAARRVGLRAALKACSFAVVWGVALDGVQGGSLTARLQAYARWAKIGERTAWDELRAFRAAFPAYSTPDELVGRALAEHGDVAALPALQLARTA